MVNIKYIKFLNGGLKMFIYKGDKTKVISFPLGGIGSGCIGLGGDGRLIDWEIFNRPNKGSRNGFSHFAIKAEDSNHVLDARVLNGELKPPFIGEMDTPKYSGYGFGPSNSTMAGMPNFKDTVFKGAYPFANIEFNDDRFPGSVNLTAFNPFIPLNDKDSSIPGAFFEIEITNTTRKTLNYTVNLAMQNPVEGNTINGYSKRDNLSIMNMSSDNPNKDDINYGDMSIATSAAQVSYQEYGYRGGWFDTLGIYWREFLEFGETKNRYYLPAEKGEKDTCVLSAKCTVAAGEIGKIRFVMTWNFPNCCNYWSDREGCGCGDGFCDASPNIWKNYYASLYILLKIGTDYMVIPNYSVIHYSLQHYQM